MKDLTLKKRINKILEDCKKYGFTAYEISNSTGLSATGVQKILDKSVQKPREKTLITIENYITNKRIIPVSEYDKFSEEGESYQVKKETTIEDKIAIRVAAEIKKELKMILDIVSENALSIDDLKKIFKKTTEKS